MTRARLEEFGVVVGTMAVVTVAVVSLFVVGIPVLVGLFAEHAPMAIEYLQAYQNPLFHFDWSVERGSVGSGIEAVSVGLTAYVIGSVSLWGFVWVAILVRESIGARDTDAE